MNTPTTINIEKYAEALNNLIGVDSAYFQGDKDVDAILELIVAAKKLENRVKELEAEKNNIAEDVLNALENRIKEAWGARTMFMPPREGYLWNDEFIDVKTVYKFINEFRDKSLEVTNE